MYVKIGSLDGAQDEVTKVGVLVESNAKKWFLYRA